MSPQLRVQVRLSEPIGLHSLILASLAGGPESSSVPQATSSSIAIVVTSTSTPTSVAATKSKKSNVGAIVGGVVGGLAFLGIAVGLIAFVILRGRKRSAPTTSTYSAVAVTSPELMMSNGYHSTISTMPSGKIYVSPVGWALLFPYSTNLMTCTGSQWSQHLPIWPSRL